MSKPLFSVIIPAYNEEEYIEKCLRSLEKQDLRESEFEVIIVDNASTDRTAQIAKKFPFTIVSEPVKSVVVARQKGVDESKGKIIVSADADTIYPKNWLSTIKKSFKKDGKLIAVVGWIHYPEAGNLVKWFTNLHQEINLTLYKTTGKFPLAFAANFAFKKSVLKRIGGYPTHLPELGDQQYLLNKFHQIGKVKLDKNIYCMTSSRRHKEKRKNIFVHNLWYRLLGYPINRIAGKQIIGPAPAIRQKRKK